MWFFKTLLLLHHPSRFIADGLTLSSTAHRYQPLSTSMYTFPGLLENGWCIHPVTTLLSGFVKHQPKKGSHKWTVARRKKGTIARALLSAAAHLRETYIWEGTEKVNVALFYSSILLGHIFWKALHLFSMLFSFWTFSQSTCEKMNQILHCRQHRIYNFMLETAKNHLLFPSQRHHQLRLTSTYWLTSWLRKDFLGLVLFLIFS